jgi:hypothetical protein
MLQVITLPSRPIGFVRDDPADPPLPFPLDPGTRRLPLLRDLPP